MPDTNISIDIIRKLNSINVDFYNKSALFFDNSRSYNWEGWDSMLDRLNLEHEEQQAFKKYFSDLTGKLGFKKKKSPQIKVLDLGCGNGRFYAYLNRRFTKPFQYTGLDTNEFLIEKAVERYPNDNAKFLVENMGNADHLLKDKFDLVAVFGVMHHIPGPETRVKLLEKCRNLLAPQGFLVFTTWQFLNIPRVAKSVVKENTPEGKQIYADLNLSPEELQTNDYILDWQRGITAYRYCHYYTEEEVRQLVQTAGLRITDIYEADGIEGELNKYYICQI